MAISTPPLHIDFVVSFQNENSTRGYWFMTWIFGYEKVLRQVEALLGEIKKAEEKKPKKSSNSSEKQKNQTEDGVVKKATGE